MKEWLIIAIDQITPSVGVSSSVFSAANDSGAIEAFKAVLGDVEITSETWDLFAVDRNASDVCEQIEDHLDRLGIEQEHKMHYLVQITAQLEACLKAVLH